MTNLDYLSQLTEDQRQAVTGTSSSLQILAGPGSGKTRVLTTRVAWLVKEQQIDPSSIVVVTFTNKAAKEMKERLDQPLLLGYHQARQLRMGTFHSFCSRVLRLNVDLTPFQPNFVIIDASRSLQLIESIKKDLKNSCRLSAEGGQTRAAVFQRYISSVKSKGQSHLTYMVQNANHPYRRDTALIYKEYEERLLEENLIDFDGLLLYCRDLLQNHPGVVEYIEHVLVDEYQDTNSLQYELLWLLTNQGKKPITVVGDPDQSIFGWRAADKTHFLKMRSQYQGTEVVDLKENFRCTKTILEGATHVVRKDRTRPPRELFTNNHEGIPISVLKVATEIEEADVVASEISRIIKYSNGLVKYSDIAIMFRMNFLTLNFEQALSRERIPYVLVSGTRFLDRMEVKDILSYVSFFYNPKDSISFQRLINVPKRGLGDASIRKIQSIARDKGWNIMETLQAVVDNHPVTMASRIMDKAKEEVKKLLEIYQEFQDSLDKKVPIGVILNTLIESIGYEDYLKTKYEKEFERKFDNVRELVSFASQCVGVASTNDRDPDSLGHFLETTSLCGDSKEHDDAQHGKVSLITMHAAKGLEWPCAFVVGCEDGIIPMAQTSDLPEESRVLYVAMTRAKCLLYCTHAARRSRWDTAHNKPMLSRFLYDLPVPVFMKSTPTFGKDLRHWMAEILRVSYVETEGLELDDPGKEYDSYDDSESTLDGSEDEASLLIPNYEILEELRPSYQRQRSSPLPASKRFPFSYQIPTISDQHKLSSSQKSKSSPKWSTSLPSSSFSSSLHLLSTTTSKVKSPSRLPFSRSSSSLSTLSCSQSSGSSTTSLTSKTTYDSILSSSSPLPSTSSLLSSPSLSSSSSSSSSRSSSLRSPTTANNNDNNSTRNKSNHKKRKTTRYTFEQCITHGIQQAALGKTSFTLSDAVSAVHKEIKTNGQDKQLGKSFEDLVTAELESLVFSSALVKLRKENGAIKYFISE